MSTTLIVILVVIALAAFLLIAIFNKFMAMRQVPIPVLSGSHRIHHP